MKYVVATLKLINWTSQKNGTSGSTWASTNVQPKAKVSSFFGDTTTGYEINRRKSGQTFTKTVAPENEVTVWLSNWDNDLKKFVSLSKQEVDDLVVKNNLLLDSDDNPTCIVAPDDSTMSHDEYQGLVDSGQIPSNLQVDSPSVVPTSTDDSSTDVFAN